MFTTETIRSTRKKFSFTIESTQIQPALSSRLARLQKTAKVNGFRNGKVPASVIKRMYGKDALMEIAERLAHDNINTATKEQGIEPVQITKIDSWPENDQSSWEFSVEIDYIPTFDLPELSSVDVEIINANITDAYVEKTITNMRQQAAELEPVEQAIAAEENHVAAVKLHLTIIGADGKTQVHTTTKEEIQPMLLGVTRPDANAPPESLSFPQRYVAETLIGRKKGDSYEVTFSVPSDDGIPQWQGCTAHYQVTVEEIFTQKIPALDKDFVARFIPLQDDTQPVEKLRHHVRAHLENRLQKLLFFKNSGTLFQAIADKCQVELPEVLIDRARTNMLIEESRRAFASGLHKEQVTEYLRNYSLPDCANLVKVDTVVSELCKQLPLTASGEEVRNYIIQDAMEYDDPKKFVENQLQNEQAYGKYHFYVLREKLYNKILEEDTINITKLEEQDAEQLFFASDNKKTATVTTDSATDENSDLAIEDD